MTEGSNALYMILLLANTLDEHKTARGWMLLSLDGVHHSQTYYILVMKNFSSGIRFTRKRFFPGAEVRSDHDMMIMTFQTRLKASKIQTLPRIRFELENLIIPRYLMLSMQQLVVDLLLLLC